MPDEREAPVGHEAYSREHALWHVWKAARYYSTFEALEEMLKVERKQHESDSRTGRMSVLEFSKRVLDNLVDQELLEAHRELTTHLERIGKLPCPTKSDQT